MTIPNILTLIRFILAGLVIYFTAQNTLPSLTLAIFIFFLGMATDFADGIIARRYGMITNFGKIADPIADKLLTLGAFTSFVLLGLFNIWILIFIALREIGLTVVRLIALKKNIVLAAEKLGKIKTASQMIIILCIYCLLIIDILTPVTISGLVINIFMIYLLLITLISGINFLWNNKTTLKTIWTK